MQSRTYTGVRDHTKKHSQRIRIVVTPKMEGKRMGLRRATQGTSKVILFFFF